MATYETVKVTDSRYSIKSYRRRKRPASTKPVKRRLSEHKPRYQQVNKYGEFV